MLRAAATGTRTVLETHEEALRLFSGKGLVLSSLNRLTADLRRHDIGYLVIGAVALIHYGFQRYTENIDVILTNEGLRKFGRELLGRGGLGLDAGYDSISEDAKSVRSYPEGVVINFKIAGEFPGDGKPKPVSFPEPSDASYERVKFPTLEKLVELKLASGLSAPDRLKDLADVQEMIKIKILDRGFADKLSPYVCEMYLELFAAVERGRNNNFQE